MVLSFDGKIHHVSYIGSTPVVCPQQALFNYIITHLFDLHWLLLQILASKVLPLHFPLPESQFLSLDLIPPPQVWEH